jgi:hypothetical protein
MSDLQDLHRQASRALISFAPSILDKPASSECPERMGWHISVLTKAAPWLQAEHYRTQSPGKIAVRRSKRLNRRNSESQIERPVTRAIETICPFGGLSQGLKRSTPIHRPAVRRRLPRAGFCRQGRGVSSNSGRPGHDRWRQDRRRCYGGGFVQQRECEPGRVCPALLRDPTKDEPAGRRRAAATMERPQELEHDPEKLALRL